MQAFVFIYKKKSPNVNCVQTQSSGMSGDTELFQKPSNIKGLRASEQEIILYIPTFYGDCFETAALFLTPKINVLIRVEKASFFLFVLPIRKRTWVIYHPACQSGTEVTFFSENNTFLNFRKYITYSMLHLTKRVNRMWTIRIRVIHIRETLIWITHVWKTGHN